jgi:hypothetical protein
MKSRFAYAKPLALLIAASAVIFAIASYAKTDERQRRASFHWSGLFGIAMGETANLNYTNGDRDPAEVVMMFLDTSGGVIKSSRARVAPGHSFGLLLPYSETNSRAGRVQVRALVRFARPSDSALSISSVEVFDDATGRTSFGLLLPAVGFDPQPDPPGQE